MAKKAANGGRPVPKRGARGGRTAPARRSRGGSVDGGGPLTLEQARALVRAQVQEEAKGLRFATRRAGQRGAISAVGAATPDTVGVARQELERERRNENGRRIREYTQTLALLKQRGVKGLTSGAVRRHAPGRRPAAAVAGPLQMLAEGDSWFDYPYPLFGGGIIKRLENLVGVPILNLAKAGDEVRYMLGVAERTVLIDHLTRGCPAGGQWDVLLFSGGGNDVVDNPMALWIKDFDPSIPPAAHLHQARFDAVLALVRAGYEDLIGLRDALSPTTHLFLHAYDFAIPDGRGACHLGPWLKPTLDLRRFPTQAAGFAVVKEMLGQFASMLRSLARPNVTLISTQGTLVPQRSSWHNELHPSKAGFNKFADIFRQELRQRFPGRVL